MTTFQRWALAAAFLAIVVAAFLGRWEIVMSSDQDSTRAYRLDRWTGSVVWLTTSEGVTIPIDPK